MRKLIQWFSISLYSVILVVSALILQPAFADTVAEIDRDVNAGLQKLYSSSPLAKQLSKVAKGILVFPNVIKGGLIVGGQYGVGALREGEKTFGYYNTVAASYGLQAGAQSFGYALFFMTDAALEHIEKSSGWEIGFGTSTVVVDEGVTPSLTTTTAKAAKWTMCMIKCHLRGARNL
jgi:lipid-binding SYLF domain-containing protein